MTPVKHNCHISLIALLQAQQSEKIKSTGTNSLLHMERLWSTRYLGWKFLHIFAFIRMSDLHIFAFIGTSDLCLVLLHMHHQCLS